MKTLLALFPIVIATAGIFKTRKTFPSMLTGSLFGFVLYVCLKGISESTVFNVFNVCKTTLLDNYSVLLSVYLLMILVYLIKNSTIIDAVNATTTKYMNSPVKFLGFMLLFSILFSLDDYLACLALGAIMSEAARKNGYSLERTAYMINISAVCCCCLSPFSSWAPVIRSALASAGDDSIYYTILPHNLSAITGLFMVVALCLFTDRLLGLKKGNKAVKAVENGNDNDMRMEMLAFSAVFTTIIVLMAYLNFVRHASYSLIKSTIPAVLMALIVFYRIKAIDLNGIKTAFLEASDTSFSLSTLLLSIWLLTNVCNNLLLLGSSISAWTLTFDLPYLLLPAGTFVITGCFAFSTGSAYGAFGLFIPLAAQLSSNCPSDTIRILCIAAAVSGSLLASGSFSSDTLKLSADSTGCDLMKLQYDQLPLTGLLFVLGVVGFLIAGLSSVLGRLMAAVLPYSAILVAFGYYTASKRVLAIYTCGFFVTRACTALTPVSGSFYCSGETIRKINLRYSNSLTTNKHKRCNLTTLEYWNTFACRKTHRKAAFI